jgi:ribosomal protein L29
MKKSMSELRAKSIKELLNQQKLLRTEIAKAKLEFKVNQPKDTNVIMKKRKKLAVLLTILGEKKELEKLQKK